MIFDIIGDIHGHADELRLILSKLGYRERNGGHAQRNHQAIFVGDFVDRGAKIGETLEIVRSMVDRGAAVAVLGNHEFNAICYHTEDGRGDFLRSHISSNGKNARQHEATLEQLAHGHPEEWKRHLDWFKGLPLFLELDGLRVVHAAWDPTAIRVVRGRSFHDNEFLRKSARKGTKEFSAVETLLKGPEIALPPGPGNLDKEGIDRTDMRVAWWKSRTQKQRFSYSELAIPGAAKMPDSLIPPKGLELCPSYGTGELPVFFGHYWLFSEAPSPLAQNAVCVDYSVAKAGGQLVAYTWQGERTLKSEHFTSVPGVASRCPQAGDEERCAFVESFD